MDDPLLDILLPAIPNETRQNLNLQQYHNYLDHIRTLGPDSVDLERHHLQTALDGTQTTLASLAHSSHDQIIKSSQTVHEVTQLFGEFKNLAEQFDLVQLADAQSMTPADQKPELTDAFSDSEELLILRNLDKIQDILETPSLAMTCVRNGYYSEALDLVTHVRRLGVRFTNVKTIQMIQKDMAKVISTLQDVVLKQLCGNVRVPTQIKIIGHLRRAEILSQASNAPIDEASQTAKLQYIYLGARMRFLTNFYESIDSLSQTSPDKYLKKYIEFFREHVFAAVTGYRAIFMTDPDMTLLSDFINHNVKQLYRVVQEFGSKITDESTRSSLWLQLSYCSQSLGRVGAEFWPSLQGQAAQKGPISDEEWNETIIKRMEISQRLGQIIN